MPGPAGFLTSPSSRSIIWGQRHTVVGQTNLEEFSDLNSESGDGFGQLWGNLYLWMVMWEDQKRSPGR